MKGSMSGDARDFNNMETLTIIKFFSRLQGKAPKEIHDILTETLGKHAPPFAPSNTGWPSLTLVIFPPVMRLVPETQNSDQPADY